MRIGRLAQRVSEIEDWKHVTYRFYINDAVRQQGDTAYLPLSVGEYLCNMSQAFTIEAGDVVMIGTPAGVGRERGDQLKMVLNGKTQQLFGFQPNSILTKDEESLLFEAGFLLLKDNLKSHLDCDLGREYKPIK